MNKQRRKALDEIVNALNTLDEKVQEALSTLRDALADVDVDDIRDRLEAIRDDEQEALDNLSENLQQSARGQAMGAAVDALENAVDQVEQLDTKLGELRDVEFDVGEIINAIEEAQNAD